MMKKVLLTGITGFLGSHTAIQLLEKGYEVVGTLRDHKRSASIRQVIVAHTDKVEHLYLEEIDLLSDLTKWEEVMEGIDYVMHIASPFPSALPKHENDLIIPAKEGTLSVLKAATAKGVKKVVLTSSAGAIVYGVSRGKQFDETDWTDETNRRDTTPYFRSKTIAEKAAWQYIHNTPNAPQLVTIQPGGIIGPVLEKDFGTSANLVKKLMDGSVPALPNIKLELVDVRSVANLHIKAMEDDKANGERFIAANGLCSFKDVADVLRKKYPDRKIPTKMLPDWLVRMFSLIDKEMRPLLLELGANRSLNTKKATQHLGWQPIPLQQGIIDCAESLINLKIVK